ncbi:MAG TPA: GNAT family N-acetyltransferase [Pseudomonas sp.]|nr:GNAT family N-acetyltransferase [Pseudomonas sp.]
MIIEHASQLSPDAIAHCDFSFEVTAELVAPYEALQARAVAPYRKAYEFDAEQFARVGADQVLLVARDAGRVCGYLLASEDWNRYGLVDDFAVDRGFRGTGLATQLMDHAIAWAKTRGLPGLRLETQSNNVPACRFYRRQGFELGGFDRYIYSALEQPRNEVALFWYLRFGSSIGG